MGKTYSFASMNQIHFSPMHISWASSLCNLINTDVSVNVLVGAVLLPRHLDPNGATGLQGGGERMEPSLWQLDVILFFGDLLL